jgi:hypothetical protein
MFYDDPGDAVALPAPLPTVMNFGCSFLRTIAALAMGGMWAGSAMHAGTVQMINGTILEGAVSVDGGLLIKGKTTVKVALAQVFIVRFADAPMANEYPAGLVLVNGTRIAGNFTPLSELTVRVEEKGIRIPSEEVAWAVYQPFPATLAASIPKGKTGALLRGGDFFEGVPKGGDRRSGKVVNSIFGPRTFNAESKQIHALVQRGIAPQAAAFVVHTLDGSRYFALDVTARDTVGVVLRHPHYDGLQIAAAELVEIRAVPHRVIFLAERESSPGREKEPGQAAVFTGSTAKLGAGKAVTWSLPTSGGTFLARAVVAPETPAGNKLVFVIIADDRVIFRSQFIDPGSPPLLLNCTIPAANTLTLRVEGVEGAGVLEDPVIVGK